MKWRRLCRFTHTGFDINDDIATASRKEYFLHSVLLSYSKGHLNPFPLKAKTEAVDPSSFGTVPCRVFPY